MNQNTYNQFADRYAQEYIQPDGERNQFNFNRDVVIPPLLDVAGDVAGLTVLDAGCGEGVVSRMLAERGADVTGVDVAQGMLLRRLVDVRVPKTLEHDFNDHPQIFPFMMILEWVKQY